MIAHIILAKRGTLRLAWFDYLVPPELKKTVAVGHLVVVPFRSGEMFGVVRSLTAEPEAQAKKLKTIKEIVHSEPFLSPEQLAWLEEMAIFFHTSLGFLIKMNLLPLQKRKLKTWTAKKENSTKAKHRFEKPRVFVYSSSAEKKEYLSTHITAPGQTLVLVPEVGDIDLILNSLTAEQQTWAVTITGEISPKKLFVLWQQVWSGEKNIIIGTRRALFLPFYDLAAIIVDDEGNESHKSFDQAPRCHARDAAFMLARHHGAPVHLLTHTPTVETYYFAKEKVYETVSKSLLNSLPQHYTILDIKNDRRGGNFSAITADLAEQILATSQGTIFLFCHRRGTLGYVNCRDCKKVLNCPSCQEPLTYHATTKTLECHRCGHRETVATTCTYCRGTNIAMYGPGTEQVENELKKLLPKDPRPIVAIDSDTPQKLSDAPHYIIIGTQYAWPSIPWSKVNLMAFIDVDTPLFVPEYKTNERLWQILTRALFLIPETALLFVQTSHPEHNILQALATPELFYTHELAERRLFKYPPYRFVLRLFTGEKNYSSLKREMEQIEVVLKRLTKNDSAVTITPAADMFPRFQRGLFWQTIIIKIGYGNYKKVTRQILTVVPETWKVDPNPNTLLSL